MDLRNLPPIDTASFFKWKGSVCKGSNLGLKKMLDSKHKLSEMGEFLSEEEFASVGLAWDDGGLSISVQVNVKFQGCFFPLVGKGDGIELFIDSRGVEDVNWIHKYCHHFVFLPKEVDGYMGAEVTRFRGEDRHDHCSPDKLSVDTSFSKSSYSMEIVIPSFCLFGYDPQEYKRISFGYKVHRMKDDPQHFPMSGKDYKFESHPSLWSNLELS